MAVDFVCQGVTQPFPEPNGSVDVINASGIVGHHLKPETMRPLLAEIERVLKPEGLAMLDVGPTMRGGVLRRIMAEAGFAFLGHYRCWFGDLTGEMVFRRPSM
jgi:SAM-dependent methyltransferase